MKDRSLKLYYQLAEHLPLAVTGVDRSGIVFFANRRFLSLLGKTNQEVVGHPLSDLLPDDGDSGVDGEVRTVRFQNRTWTVEPVNQADARFLCFFPMDDGVPTVKADETHRIDFDLDDLFSSLYDDVMITDHRGTILKVSGNFEKIYGKSSGDLVGKNVEQLEREKVFHPSITKRVLRKQTKQTGVQQTRGGRRVLVTAVPVFDREGRAFRVICYSRDITEPMRLKEIMTMMEQEMLRIQSELKTLREQRLKIDGIIAVNETMKKTMDMVRKVSPVDVNVLLQGESGVGKTAIARCIHKESARSGGPFIEVNCGAIPDALFESELFGYEAGSFTGASKKGKIGFAELAHGGTLFLDEVGELSPASQVKVLQLIQDKQFYRIGGTKPVRVNFRLIAATNQNLEKMVKEGRFREDLFFRLNVVPVTVPPLRSRTEDLLPLIHHFIEKYRRKYGMDKVLDAHAVERLMEYSWPGNVRELENLIERLMVTVESDVIREEDLPDQYRKGQDSDLFRVDEERSLPDVLAEVEKRILIRAKERCKSTTQMARLLGISQSSVVRKLQKHAISR